MKKRSLFLLLPVLFAGSSAAQDFESDIKRAENNFTAIRLFDGLELPLPIISASMPEGPGAAPDVFGYLKTLKMTEPDAIELPPAPYKSASPLSRPVGRIVYSVDLEKVRDSYLKTRITFKTGRGTTVHVSGAKTSNCPGGGKSCDDTEKFFVILTADKNETVFIRAMDIVNWGIFMGGSEDFLIDGDQYTAKIHASASVPENSRLEITGPGGVAIASTLKKVSDAVAEKGIEIKLSRDFRLAYGNELVQGAKGGRFTDKMLVMLLPFPVEDATKYFVLKADDMKRAGVMYPELEKEHGFRIVDGTLEIFKLE